MAQNTHFKLVSLHKSPTGICNKFQNKMDGQSQQLHSISLVRKSILFKKVSSPHWPQFFLKCGSEWVILIYSNMGFTYFSLFYVFLIVFLEKKNKSLILFLLYSCLPDIFWIITSSGTHLISVGRRGAGSVVLWKGIFIWKEGREKIFV